MSVPLLHGDEIDDAVSRVVPEYYYGNISNPCVCLPERLDYLQNVFLIHYPNSFGA
jgi:hypothetical protein